MIASWNLFIDDLRDPSYVKDGREYKLARSVAAALELISRNGLPAHIAFDHDLGWQDLPTIKGSFLFAAPAKGEEAPSGMVLAKWLVENDLDGHHVIPEDFTWSVHSSNPTGAANIDACSNHS
jgi:hypothetical protein